mmetsp:Transcript_28797/g.46220  ORF Transcript_28797/g.46220 Transcript_28797/m.46220 type:complete len:83 (-) Transcript_28797:910-1158(-)
MSRERGLRIRKATRQQQNPNRARMKAHRGGSICCLGLECHPKNRITVADWLYDSHPRRCPRKQSYNLLIIEEESPGLKQPKI